MTFVIAWTEEALQQADALLEYIAGDNPAAANRLWERLQAATLPLAEHPYLCRPGRKPGTRELVVQPSYILVYRVEVGIIRIVAALHSRQRYPRSEF